MSERERETSVVKAVLAGAIILGFVTIDRLYPELTGSLVLVVVSLGLWTILAVTVARWSRYVGGTVLLVGGGGLLFLGLAWPVFGLVGMLCVAHGGWLAMTGAAGLEY